MFATCFVVAFFNVVWSVPAVVAVAAAVVGGSGEGTVLLPVFVFVCADGCCFCLRWRRPSGVVKAKQSKAEQTKQKQKQRRNGF